MRIIKTKASELATSVSRSIENLRIQSGALILLVVQESIEKKLSKYFPDEKFDNISQLLSKRLISFSRKERQLNLECELKNIALYRGEACYFKRIQILFSQDLNNDPIKLLHKISRKKPIVAIWPGSFDEHNLFYATPGHPEYINYQISELQGVQVISTCEHGVTK